jgi:hypothetical protein
MKVRYSVTREPGPTRSAPPCADRGRILAVVATVLAAVGVHVAAAQAQTLPAADLLQRMAASVQTFVDNFTNVVAEEEYRQDFRLAAPRRRLKSDFLLVGYPGQDKLLMTFRDVLEVDGRPVRDQQERLTKLFLEPFQDAVRRAGEIQREGSRHSVERGRLMDPLQVMALLQREYQEGFRFTLRGLEPSLGDGVREMDMEQVIEPEARQMPLRARVWVVEGSGRVVRTELRAGVGVGTQTTTTTFGFDPVLRIDVPLQMRDTFPSGRTDEFQGVARYSRFRRFQVSAEQEVDLPPTPR